MMLSTKNKQIVFNTLITTFLTVLTLATLHMLAAIGDINVTIENKWLNAGGVIAGYIVIFSIYKRTIFGDLQNEPDMSKYEKII